MFCKLRGLFECCWMWVITQSDNVAIDWTEQQGWLLLNLALVDLIIVHLNVLNYLVFILPGYHKHRLHRRGEPYGPELLQYDVQPHANDVPEPLPDRLLTDGRSGRLPYLQPVSLPLLLCGPPGGLELLLKILVDFQVLKKCLMRHSRLASRLVSRSHWSVEGS